MKHKNVAQMEQYGLIGFPLGHSSSKSFFEKKFKDEQIFGASFELFSIETLQSLPAILESYPALRGLAVTIPYKQQILALLHDVDAAAAKIGAVNCIQIRDKKMIGFNTDVLGFAHLLNMCNLPTNTQALVLGTGGASAAVQHVLNERNIPFQLVSRQLSDCDQSTISYQQLLQEIISTHALIINTTPVGMSPNLDDCPEIPYKAITPKHVLIDLIYNPAETLFLKKGKSQGAFVINGYPMFEKQAQENWRIWNS